MKVLFLSSSLAPHYGGAAFSESALSGHLEQAVELTVLSRAERLDSDFALRQGIKKIISFSSFSIFWAFVNPWHKISQEIQRADVFHLNGHWFWENYFFARLCQRYRVPYILHPRGMLWVAYRKPRLKKLFNSLLGNWIVSHAEKIILLSQFEKKHLQGYPFTEEQIEIIPNGISDVIPHEKTRPKDNYFLFLGRIEARKNLEFLVRSFAKAFDANADLRLRLVGPVERGYDLTLSRLIEKLKLEKVVSIEPPVYDSKKTELYKNAIALIYPAIEEPFGRSIFEAFASGTVCLVPAQSGGAEYVQQFAPELIYEDQSVDSLSAKMTKVLGWSQPFRVSKVEKAQGWVSTHLDWAEISRRVLDLYMDVKQLQKQS